MIKISKFFMKKQMKSSMNSMNPFSDKNKDKKKKKDKKKEKDKKEKDKKKN